MTVSDPRAYQDVRVSALQCGLNAKGASLTVDGVWGPATKRAMDAFVARAPVAYGYVPMETGATIATITELAASVLRCPATAPTPTPATVPAPMTEPQPFPWGWAALGAGVLVGGFLWWRYA